MTINQPSKYLNWLLSLSFLSASILSYGQFSDFIYPNDSVKIGGKIDIYIHAGADTDASTIGLIKAFVKGGFIEREKFDDSYPDNDLNSVAAQVGFKIDLDLPIEKLISSDLYNINFNYFVESELITDFTNDAYGLLFYGNKRFLGDSADISDTHVQEWTMHSIGIGVHQKKNNSRIGLNFYRGSSRHEIKIDKGFLYTSEDGQLIGSEVHGSLISSIDVSEEVSNSYGLGLGLNGLWNIPLNESKDMLSFEFHNVGVMTWPDKVQKQELDSIYNFEGINLTNAFDDSSVNDSLNNFNDFYSFNKTVESRTEMLPTRLRLNYLKLIRGNNYVNLGLSSQFLNDWDPEYRLGFTHRFKPLCYLGVEAKYGGYGSENVNLHGKFLLGKAWLFRINASYLTGLISDNGKGGFVGIGITKLFNRKSKNNEED